MHLFRKIWTGISLILLVNQLFSQDIGVINISSPASGCTLGNETVTVQVFNFGPPITGSFNVSYTINAGTPVTETIVLIVPLNTSATYTYTFTALANLSTPGTYVFTAYTSLTGDTNPGNDALTNYSVVNYALTNPGTLGNDSAVCSGNNSGVLNLTGNNGSVLNWEFSTDGGTNWNNIANSTNSLNYSNINVTTLYRVRVQNGLCSQAVSNIATISILPSSVGGTVNSSTTVCSGTNSGTLILSGHVGNVQFWQTSINGGLSWNNISNTTTTQSYFNLTQSTWYRAVVQNAGCAADTSSIATITVGAASVGGNITPATFNVCSGNNSGTLKLNGYFGNVLNWQSSTDGGNTWNTIVNTTDSLVYTNITQNTLFRAEVQSCPPSVFSAIATINVDPPTAVGTLNGNATVCANSNSGTISLSSHTGNILYWEQSTDGGSTWTNISNTTPSYNYNNLLQTTAYRVVVKSGVCDSLISNTVIITVNNSDAGTLSGTSDVCIGINNGTITATGVNGVIIDWQQSVDNGVTWTTLANTSNTHSFTNLIQSTLFILIAQDGVCPPDTSTPFLVTVSTPSIAGVLTGDTIYCENVAPFQLILTNYTANGFVWQQSLDAIIWQNTTGNNQAVYLNHISEDTYFRVIANNGGCAPDTSNFIKVKFIANNLNAGSDTVIIKGESITLNATGADIYSWQPNSNISNAQSASPLVYPTETTDYIVSGITPEGCIFNDTVNVRVVDENSFLISNLITRNNDGLNDTWYIEDIEYLPENEVQIFNEYGQKIFAMNNYNNSWDGGGLPDGVYYYLLVFKSTNKIFKGHITILSK